MTDRESHYKETLFKTKEQPVATTKQLYPMTEAQKEFMSKPTQYGKLPPSEKPEEREVLYANATGTYKLVQTNEKDVCCFKCAFANEESPKLNGDLLCGMFDKKTLR